MKNLPPKEDPPEEVERPSVADLRMAELLAADQEGQRPSKVSLEFEGSQESEDVLQRLRTLDFVDSVVGEDGVSLERIGEYRILDVLGRGGMGTVYLAFEEGLERQVALKVLSPRFSADITMRKRFRAEARATAALHHQHIVPIFDFGETHGKLYFAMEVVRGVSLDKHISAARRKKQLAMECLEASQRFAGVADALALAHKRQILHRDVKPGNLLVDADGTLALADFGLSKFLGEASIGLTSVGGFFGTLHYASPEQARGEGLTPASDLYSLGVTIFETVTGQLPLAGESTEAMLQNLLHSEPPRLRQVLPKAPRDLETVLDKLLQKDPRDRYPDGESLALDLIRISQREPIRIRRQTWIGRLWRRGRRNPLLSASLLAATVLLLTSLVLGWEWVASQDRERLSKGEDLLRQALRETQKEPGTLAAAGGLLGRLTGMPPTAQSWDSPALTFLQEAEELLEDDPRPQAFRNAYLAKDLPVVGAEMKEAMQLLQQGLGLRALTSLDEAIRKTEEMDRTEATYLGLYHLYVLRCLACTTAAVADLEKARENLRFAAVVRPRARLPRLMLQLLLLPEGSANLEQAVQDPADRRIMGALLRSLAGVSPAADSFLFSLGLPYSERWDLHQLAMSWLGDDSPPSREDGLCGLSAQFRDQALMAKNNMGNSNLVDRALRPALQTLKNEVAEFSPLQAWNYTFHLLQRQANFDLPVFQRLLGALHYLDLFAAEEELLVEKDIFYSLVQGWSESQPGRQLQARLDLRFASAKQALASAKAWRQIDRDDPLAIQCELWAMLRGDLQSSLWEAQRLAIAWVQQSADPKATKQQLVQRLEVAERREKLFPERALFLRKMRLSFQEGRK